MNQKTSPVLENTKTKKRKNRKVPQLKYSLVIPSCTDREPGFVSMYTIMFHIATNKNNRIHFERYHHEYLWEGV